MGFLRKEMSQALRDSRMRGMLFIMPVVQILIFGFALSSDVRNIRLAVLARPDDAVTRRLGQHFYRSGYFTPTDLAGGDPFDWIRSGQTEAVLIAPAGGGDKTFGRGTATYQLLIDAMNAERARGVGAYAEAIMAEFLKQEGKGVGGAPFSFSVRTLYNPEGKTAIYMIPGTLCLMLTLVTVVLTSMSMAREREMGTLETLLSAPIAPWEVLLGKTVPYVILGMADLPLILTVAWMMGVPIRGPLWEIFLVTLIFVCTTVSAGFLISSYMRNQQQAMLGGFLFLFPAIQLSGVIFPIGNMPRAIAFVTYLNPVRYYVVVIRHLMLKGGDLGALIPNLAAMAALGAVALFWAGRRFRQTLN
jgi:ABC-2 type transport system permease protein